MSATVACPECGAPNDPGVEVCVGCSAFLPLVRVAPDPFSAAPPAGPAAPARPAAPAAHRLVVSVGEARHELADGERCLLGRSRQASMADVFRRYADVSAVHLEVRATRGRAALTDRSSTNGTFVAGQRLKAQEPLTTALPAVVRLASNCYVTLALDLLPVRPEPGEGPA